MRYCMVSTVGIRT